MPSSSPEPASPSSPPPSDIHLLTPVPTQVLGQNLPRGTPRNWGPACHLVLGKGSSSSNSCADSGLGALLGHYLCWAGVGPVRTSEESAVKAQPAANSGASRGARAIWELQLESNNL